MDIRKFGRRVNSRGIEEMFKTQFLKYQDVNKYKKWIYDKISHFRSQGMFHQEMEYVSRLAIELRLHRNYGEALKLVNKYLKEKEKLTPFYRGSLLREKGILMKVKEDYEFAKKLLWNSILSLEESPVLETESAIQYELALAYQDYSDIIQRQDKLKQSYKYTKKSLFHFFNICEEFDEELMQHMVLAVKNFFNICSSVGKLNESTAYLMRLMKALSSNEKRKKLLSESRASILEKVALNFYEIGYLDFSTRLVRRALFIYLRLKRKLRDDYSKIAYMILLMGMLYLYDTRNPEKFKKLLQYVPTEEMWNNSEFGGLKKIPGSRMHELDDDIIRQRKQKYGKFCGLLSKIRSLEMSLEMKNPVKQRQFWKTVLKDRKKKKVCSSCGRDTGKLLKCGNCKFFFYCSKECQKEDWVGGKYGPHRDYCVDLMKV